MDKQKEAEVEAFWDRVARDWDIQVGDDGDVNRILNSDPVLWAMAGDVAGLTVLDAGCGTGYLARELARRGADVTGVDLSPQMIRIAREHAPDMDLKVDSISSLATIVDSSVDLLVANYVLMDAPDLDGAVAACYRVLKSGGAAVFVFSHPCFPQGEAHADRNAVRYTWPESYFSERQVIDPPWNHFKSEFIWFHRPLSRYFQAFRDAGFVVTDFDEPRISEDRYELVGDPKRLQKLKERPYSVAFRLQKP